MIEPTLPPASFALSRSTPTNSQMKRIPAHNINCFRALWYSLESARGSRMDAGLVSSSGKAFTFEEVKERQPYITNPTGRQIKRGETANPDALWLYHRASEAIYSGHDLSWAWRRE